MTKLNLQGWAAIAEIIGTAAVVVSLLFLAYSVNRNTIVMQATNENFFVQMNDGIIQDLLAHSDVLAIVDKRNSEQQLTNTELMSMGVFTLRQFNLWEMAFYRNKEGLFADERWQALDLGYADGLMHGFSQCDRQCWESFRPGFGATFAAHVDAVYASP